MSKNNISNVRKIILSITTSALLLWNSPATLVLASTVTLGPISPTIVVNDTSSGDKNWINPQNATSTNSINAGITPNLNTGNSNSRILRATGYDLSSVPNAATILGVTLTVRKLSDTLNKNKDLTVELVTGSATSTNKADTTTLWPTSFTTTTYGGSADTWGLALTPAVIKSPGFGAIFAVQHSGNSNSNPEVDSMLLTVTYSITPDVTPPVISGISADLIVEAINASGAIVAYVAPTATDNIDGAVAVSCLPAFGSTFPLGATTVACSAGDAAGNTSSASFIVTVVDTTAPVIAAHATVTTEATSAAGATVTYIAPNAADAVDGSFAATCAAPSGSVFAIGDTTVTCNAEDARGNIATPTTFTVTVQDTTIPIISGMPSAMTIEAQDGSGATVTYSNPTANDLVDGAVAVSCTPPSGSVFAIGDTTVTCNATDARGNTATSSFHIIVQDSTAPILVLPSDITTEATGPSGATAAFAPTATDLVDGSLPVICTPASGSTFPLGVTTVSCSTTDTAGNITTGSFNVTIIDTTAPAVLVTPASQTVEATDALGAIASYIASATDIVDGSLTPACSPLSGSVFALGTTTVVCSAPDTHSNIGSSTATVIVYDTTPPTIIPPVNQTFEETGATTTPVLIMATATDTVDATPIITYDIHDFPLGNTAVTWTATDASGNTAATTSQVTINPKPVTPPAISGGGGGVVSGILSFGFQNNPPPTTPAVNTTNTATAAVSGSASTENNVASESTNAAEESHATTNNVATTANTSAGGEIAANNGGANSGGGTTTSTTSSIAKNNASNSNNLAAVATGFGGSLFSKWSWWWILILIAATISGRWLYRKYSEKDSGKKIKKDL